VGDSEKYDFFDRYFLVLDPDSACVFLFPPAFICFRRTEREAPDVLIFLGEDQGPPIIDHISGFSSRTARGTWMGTVPSLVLKQVVHKSLPLKAKKIQYMMCIVSREWCVPKQWELGGEGLVCAKLNEIDDVRTKFILTVCCFATSHALSRFSCDAPHLFPRMNHSSLHGCRQGCGQELSEILK